MTDVSETTVASCLTTNRTRCAGIAHTISAATAGLEYSGIPLICRDTGAVGSLCSRGLFEPAVPYSFRVLNASTVAGAATKLVTSVNRVSALAFAASNASRPAVHVRVTATVGAIGGPAGDHRGDIWTGTPGERPARWRRDFSACHRAVVGTLDDAVFVKAVSDLGHGERPAGEQLRRDQNRSFAVLVVVRARHSQHARQVEDVVGGGVVPVGDQGDQPPEPFEQCPGRGDVNDLPVVHKPVDVQPTAAVDDDRCLGAEDAFELGDDRERDAAATAAACLEVEIGDQRGQSGDIASLPRWPTRAGPRTGLTP